MAFTPVDEKVINDAVEKLMEHFETVQIFVTRTEEKGETAYGCAGRGNLFARIMQAILWAQTEQEGYLADALGDVANGEEENG